MFDFVKSGESLKDFRPRGILVAHLHEHKGAVTQIKVCIVTYMRYALVCHLINLRSGERGQFVLRYWCT